MKQNKVREVQDYLRARGLKVSETSIVNAAIDLVRRTGPGIYAFAILFKDKKK